MRLLVFIFVLVLSFIVVSQNGVALAETDVGICPGGDFNPLCDFNAGDTGTIVSNVIQILLIIAVVLSVIFLIWGGITWIRSGGDKQAVEQARSTIISALVGLIIAFAAFFIISVVLDIFGLNEAGEFTLPTLLDDGPPLVPPGNCDPGQGPC